MPRTSGREKPVIGLSETGPAMAVDLIAGLRNRRSNGRTDRCRVRAQLAHCVHGILEYALERPAPPGMRGRDHSRGVIGQQDWRAIGRYDRERQPSGSGDDRIGLGGSVPCGIHNYCMRRMDLSHAHRRAAGEDVFGLETIAGREAVRDVFQRS